MKNIPARILYLGVGLFLAAAYLGWYAWPRTDPAADFHVRAFGRLPIHHGGRVMPLDSFARMSLMAMSHRQELRLKGGPGERDKTYPATKWLLDAMVTPPPIPAEGAPHRELTVFLRKFLDADGSGGSPANNEPFFRIENDEVLSAVGLTAQPGLRYSFNEIRDAENFESFLKRCAKLRETPPREHSLADAKMLALQQNLFSYVAIGALQGPLVVPVQNGEDWYHLATALTRAPEQSGFDAATRSYMLMLKAYRAGDVREFNDTLAQYREVLEKQMPAAMGSARLESFFNEFAPFYHCAVLYGLLFVAVCVSWLIRSDDLRNAAFWTAALVLLVHTWALVIRMYLTGRPPVTNLYSSAIFIGWGCVLLTLAMELLFRNGLALAVGTVTGGLSLLVAHFLGMSGETMEVLVPVLDTNFWLATHVVCITLGYTATFVAGFMGVAYVLLGLFTPLIAGEGSRNLSRMIYGVICFATFLSFTGTVLGGIWADESWGRFWGWDPKENGALMIVLWNALVLHARWAGLVKPRGVAALAVVGNVVTAWSWFGTNLLGVGLHSYGFIQGAFWSMAAFDLAMLAIAVVGALVPMRHWRSFRPVALGLTSV